MESHKQMATASSEEKIASESPSASSSSFDPSKTAKPVLAIKHVTSQPGF